MAVPMVPTMFKPTCVDRIEIHNVIIVGEKIASILGRAESRDRPAINRPHVVRATHGDVTHGLLMVEAFVQRRNLLGGQPVVELDVWASLKLAAAIGETWLFRIWRYHGREMRNPGWIKFQLDGLVAPKPVAFLGEEQPAAACLALSGLASVSPVVSISPCGKYLVSVPARVDSTAGATVFQALSWTPPFFRLPGLETRRRRLCFRYPSKGDAEK